MASILRAYVKGNAVRLFRWPKLCLQAVSPNTETRPMPKHLLSRESYHYSQLLMTNMALQVTELIERNEIICVKNSSDKKAHMCPIESGFSL